MTVSQRFPADVALLSAARRFAQEAVRPACADEDFLYDLALAVDEAMTNVIVHGYRGAPGEITIEINPGAASVAVILIDQAPPFNPQNAPAPDTSLPLELRKPGGFGIAFIRELTDEMVYSSGEPDGNRLTLIMHYPPAARGEATE